MTPNGLSLERQCKERQWYLYDKIREFCSDSTKDLVCPKTKRRLNDTHYFIDTIYLSYITKLFVVIKLPKCVGNKQKYSSNSLGHFCKISDNEMEFGIVLVAYTTKLVTTFPSGRQQLIPNFTLLHPSAASETTH